MNKRNSSFELLRVFLALLVILYHCRDGLKSNFIFATLSPFIGASVCGFAVLTGYFSINRKNHTYSTIKLIVSTFIYVFLINLITLILKFDPAFYRYDRFNTWFFYIFGSANMWYIFSLCLMSFFVIYINHILKNYSAKSTLFSLIVLTLIYIFGFAQTSVYNVSHIDNLLLLIIMYSYGAWFFLHKDKMVKKNLSVNKLFSIILLNWIWVIYLINIVLTFSFNKYNLLFGNEHWTSMITGLTYVVIANNIYLKNNITINFLGKLTLPIYAFHYVILKYLSHIYIHPFGIYGNIANWLEYLILFITATVSTLLVSLLVYPLANLLIEKISNLIFKPFLKYQNKQKFSKET